MRIGMVTTWASHCGIATYSEGLAAGLKEHGIMAVPLAPQRVSRNRQVPGFAVTECWDRDDRGGMNPSWIPDAAEKLDLKLVHFQHEFGLFRDGLTFQKTLRAVRKLKIPVVVTLHTTPLSTHFLGRLGWLAALRRGADAIICHTMGAAASVAVVEGPGRVVQIDHGTPRFVAGDPQRGLQLLKLDRKPSSVGMAMGFISGSKNVACTALAFGEALARKMTPPDAMFFIAGDTSSDPQYLVRSLQPAMEYTGVSGMNLRLIDRFIKEEEVPHIFAAVDYGVLNTVSDNLSASGQVHQLAAFGVAAAVANKPIYVEGIMGGAIPFEVFPEAPGSRVDHPSPSLVAAIGALASNRSVREESGRRMRALGGATAWPVVAGKHAALYKELAG